MADKRRSTLSMQGNKEIIETVGTKMSGMHGKMLQITL